HIANRPPKNITSLASQTIVPICVGLGRPTAGTADGGRSVKVAVVTSPLCRVVRISALSPRRTSTPPGTAPGEPGQHIPPDAPSRTRTRIRAARRPAHAWSGSFCDALRDPGDRRCPRGCDHRGMNENIPTWSQITSRLVRGQELDGPSAAWAMDQAMAGQATAVQLAGFLVALQAKGVTSTELAALADAMVSHARPVRAPRRTVDIVGTGGDLAQTVNISTMASIIIASTGRTVVKHGNRASSSKSGSADVLEALGVRL